MGALDGQRVEILIEAVNRATATFEQVTNDLKKVKTQATETQQAFSGFGDVLTKAFSTYAVYQFAGALKDATSSVLEWMGNIEMYGIALASSLQVGGQYIEKVTGKVLEGSEAFKVAQRDAKGVMEALQVANFQTVATLEQLIRMYQEALPIAMSKGFDKKMVQDFTLSVTQAASAMGVSLDMMAEEARSLLTGAINLRNSRVAVALGITPEDIRQNSTGAQQLFDFLMKKLAVYRQAGEEIQNSWRGVWSNFKDVMTQAGAKALEPLFEGIKQQLKDIIDSIVTLDKEAGKIIWNPDFLAGINTIKNGLIEVMNIWTALRSSEMWTTMKDAMGGPSGVVGQTLGIIREPGGGMNFLQNWWNKTKEGLNSPDDTTVWLEGVLGINNPWKSDKAVKERDLKIMKEELAEVNSQQVISLRSTGNDGNTAMSEKDYYSALIYNLSKKYGVDPYKMGALVQKESNFQNVINEEGGGFGAVGPMQLRLPAMKQVGLDPIRALVPRENIEGGIKYYKYLLDRFGGDDQQAMMAWKEGEGFLKEHFSANPRATWSEGSGKTISDYDKYVRGSRFAESIKATMEKQQQDQLFGKLPETKFKPIIKMSEKEKQDTQNLFEGHINEVRQKAQTDFEKVKEQGEIEKANDLVNIKSKEERQLYNLQIDEDTTKKQIEIKKKYLIDYTAWTDQMAIIDEGKGPFKDVDEKVKNDRKVFNEKEKVQRDLNKLDSELVVSGAKERDRIVEDDRKKRETEATESAKIAREEYDNLKKINDLKIAFGTKSEVQAFEEEEEARKKLIRAQLEQIAIQLQENGLGDKAVSLRGNQAKLLEDFEKPELAALERKKKMLADSALEQKRYEELTGALLGYNQVVGDPEAVQAIERRLQISKLLYAASMAEAAGQVKTAEAYRITAAALKELNTGSDIFVGFKTAIRDMTNEIGSNVKQWAGLFKGVFSDIQSSLSSGLVDLWKGNINLGKSQDLDNVQSKISWNDAEKEKLTLQKQDIANNKDLTEAEKTQATKAIDLKLKELDANKQLLEKQKDAIENSKSAAELFQGFLDKLTQKIADFLASSVIIEFLALLSGKPFGNSPIGAFFGLGTLAVGGEKEGGGGGGVAGAAGGLVVNKGLGYVWDKAAEYFAETAIGKEIATYWASMKESLGLTTSATPTSIPAGTTGMDYVNTMGGNTPYVGESYAAAAPVSEAAVSASQYGSLAYEASPYYMGPAAEGVSTTAQGAGVASGALSYAGPVIAAAVMAYQMYSAMQYNYAEPERAKAGFGYQTGRMGELAAGKGPLAGASYGEQNKGVTGMILGMRSLREDMETGMTGEQLDDLIKKTLGPLNATLGTTSKAALDVGDTLGQSEMKTQRYADAMNDLKSKMAASRDPLDFLNLALETNSKFAVKLAADGSGLIPDPTHGIPALADATEALSFLTDVMGLTKEQSNYLKDAFGYLNLPMTSLRDDAALAGENIGKLAATLGISKEDAERLGQSLGLIPEKFEQLKFASTEDALKQLTDSFGLSKEKAAELQEALALRYNDSVGSPDQFRDLSNLGQILGIDAIQAQRLADKLTTGLQTGFEVAGTAVDGLASVVYDTVGGMELVVSSIDSVAGSAMGTGEAIDYMNDQIMEANKSGDSMEKVLQNIADAMGISIEAARELAISLNLIPKDININYSQTGTAKGEPPPPAQQYHSGGFIRYHPFGGRLGMDEIPFIGQKGEYVLSKKDVDFINKVKGTGGGMAEITSIPPILPRVNVIVNNQSGARVESAGAVRYSEDKYIIDVLLKDIHSNGRLRHALNFG